MITSPPEAKECSYRQHCRHAGLFGGNNKRCQPQTVLRRRFESGRPGYKSQVSRQIFSILWSFDKIRCFSTPGRSPVPGPGINYNGPREVLLEFVILVFLAIFMNKCFIVEILWGEKYSWMCRKIQMLAWGNYNMVQDFISPVIDN